MSPSKRFEETTFSVQSAPQDLSLDEQCCDKCGASFAFLKMQDGDTFASKTNLLSLLREA